MTSHAELEEPRKFKGAVLLRHDHCSTGGSTFYGCPSGHAHVILEDGQSTTTVTGATITTSWPNGVKFVADGGRFEETTQRVVDHAHEHHTDEAYPSVKRSRTTTTTIYEPYEMDSHIDDLPETIAKELVEIGLGLPG